MSDLDELKRAVDPLQETFVACRLLHIRTDDDAVLRGHVISVLEMAANIIAETGWWDGASDVGGAHCAATAVDRACRTLYPALQWPMAVAVKEVMCSSLGVDCIPEWNDAHGSGEDVILALKRIAHEVKNV